MSYLKLYFTNKNASCIKVKSSVIVNRAFSVPSHLSGSLTLEAALVMPLFIAALTAFIFLIQAAHVQSVIQTSLFNQTMKMSGYAYYINRADIQNNFEQIIESGYIKQAVISEIGTDYLDNTYIVNGSSGIHLNLLKDCEDGIIDVELMYEMENPFNLPGLKPLKFSVRAVCHAWIGADDENDDVQTGDYVYVVPNATVYHLYSDCSYLTVAVMSCEPEQIHDKRNESGAIYYPCERCCENEDLYGKAYYTAYGTRYHSTTVCPNLHRNVFMMDAEEAEKKYNLCSKCERKQNDN